MEKIYLCLLLCLLAFSTIQVVNCPVESEVKEELPVDFTSPELPINIPEPIKLPIGIPEPVKAEFIEPFRRLGRMYPCRN